MKYGAVPPLKLIAAGWHSTSEGGVLMIKVPCAITEEMTEARVIAAATAFILISLSFVK